MNPEGAEVNESQVQHGCLSINAPCWTDPYAKLYELINKYVEDKEKAEIIYRVVEEFIKENEKRIEDKFKNEKVVIKNELKDELKNELATKEDILILEEKMNTMEERLKRYVDNKFNVILITQIIILFAILITNPGAIELIKLLIGLK